MKVLVIPWGNPFQWEPITYKMNGYEIKSRSTLPILFEALNPEKTLIVTLDTLANFKRKTENGDIPNVEAREFSSYEEIVADVKERVHWFINHSIIEELEDEHIKLNLKKGLKNKKIEISVAPGVGVFGNITIEGNMIDFYHFIVYKLAQCIPSDLQNAEPLEVYLDLTHGINFMPTLTYRALHNLLGIAAYLDDVTITVLNSEPFPQGFFGEQKKEVVKNTVLHVRKVEETKMLPKPLYSTIDEKGMWNAFISSVTNGLPLVFAEFYPSLNEIERFLGKEFAEFKNSIEVLNNGKRVVRKQCLSEDFKTAAKLYYMLRVFNSEFNDFPKKEVTFKELQSVSRILFRKMPRIGIILENQLEDLKRLIEGKVDYEDNKLTRKKGLRDYIAYEKPKEGWIRDLKRGKPLPLLEVRRNLHYYSPSGSGANKEPTLRNFIAHSGFEYNLTWIRYNGREFVLFYKNQDKVLEFAIGALKFNLEEVNENV